MFGPLAANASPYHIDAGPLGNIYASGVLSGIGLWQDSHFATDDEALLDLSNGQIIVQTTQGPLQFYVQAGGYSLPSLGTAYTYLDKSTRNLYGPVPVAYAKIAPTDNFSILVGKLYTLIGTENTFTFQNANIQRGLLWNQTNVGTRGVQLNYAQGKVSGSVALTDGFYSGKFTWLSGLLSYAINPNNTLNLLVSGNTASNNKSTPTTPLGQNNSQIYDLSYSYTNGPWSFTPTLQYTNVPQNVDVGLTSSSATYGVGLTSKYAIDSNWSVAGRAEFIDSDGGTSLIYGAGSNAWSLTVTPTYQQGIFFARGEASFVNANDTTAGSVFGVTGNETSQTRVLFETGVIF